MIDWVVVWTCPEGSPSGERCWERFDSEEEASESVNQWNRSYPNNNYVVYVRSVSQPVQEIIDV